MVFFGGFFDERGGGHYIFCVFFLYLFAERISEAPMSRVGDIIFSAWFVFIYSPKGSAKLRWAGRGSGDII
jgi:hypothetical protein